jgi:hypothetical protein
MYVLLHFKQDNSTLIIYFEIVFATILKVLTNLNKKKWAAAHFYFRV